MSSGITITYKKWWHRFFPKYRRAMRYMKTWLDLSLENGLEAELAKARMDVLLFGRGFYRKKDFEK